MTKGSWNGAVADYYRSTERDYARVWSGQARAFHFGYFDVDTRTHNDSLLRMNRAVAEVAGIGRSDRVIDAGCGLGGSAVWLGREIGCEVLGVNILESQVERASAFARDNGLADRVRFTVADYVAVPEPDGSADVVWALESLAHGPDKPAFFAEAFRLLRPGGCIVVAETFLRSDPAPTPAEQADIDIWARGMAVPQFLSDRECVACMERAGFGEVEIHNFTPNVRRSFARLSRLLVLTAPIQWLRTVTGRNDPVRLLNKQASAACCRGLATGSWRYLAITARKPN